MENWGLGQVLLRDWGEEGWLKKYGASSAGHGINLLSGYQVDYLKEKMNDRFCKKCNHLCHCIEADHSDCKCENCECMQREEDKTYE